jgi:murein L,D-transpeptidase YcbB/YkuD
VHYLIRLLLVLLLCPLSVPAISGPSGGGPQNAESWASTRFSSFERALAFYRQLADDHDWGDIPATPLLQAGDRHSIVAEIRHRLALLGDLPYPIPGRDPAYFDEDLHWALVHFQQRHSLRPDGVWGPRSRAALNVPPATRYRQLLLNRDRQQRFWQQLQPGGDYVQINIPAYEMRYFERGQEVLRMRAIVGKLAAKTPLLTSEIHSLELNPDWNVPGGIAYRDIVPELEQGPDYLDEHSLELVEGYGDRMRRLSFRELDYERLYRGTEPQQRFWQAAGPENPLGQMKFNFPNDYLIFMHGTPSAHLFDKPVRNFSAGCVRIEYPEILARRLLGTAGLSDRGTWRFEDIIASGENRVLSLPRPVAVYTTYWTAWIDEDQRLQFRDDIYGRDRQILASLADGGAQPATAASQRRSRETP